ncbi:hypothetical protein U370_02060 [Anaplasma marginale str. Dawn]|nr:hypothetical protein U128_02095 [Anaplasma marginale str. Gypsy Plains]AGZ79640.1 hypothetical protein U370_02060 [Anaplasma marginale str. Dawn]
MLLSVILKLKDTNKADYPQFNRWPPKAVSGPEIINIFT